MPKMHGNLFEVAKPGVVSAELLFNTQYSAQLLRTCLPYDRW